MTFDFMSFVVGGLVFITATMFAGWLDVAVLKKPKVKINDSPIKWYIFVCAWEMMFFIVGLLVGFSVGGGG